MPDRHCECFLERKSKAVGGRSRWSTVELDSGERSAMRMCAIVHSSGRTIIMGGDFNSSLYGFSDFRHVGSAW